MTVLVWDSASICWFVVIEIMAAEVWIDKIIQLVLCMFTLSLDTGIVTLTS